MRVEVWAALLIASSVVCDRCQGQTFLERLEQRIRDRLEETTAEAPRAPAGAQPQAARPTLGLVAEQRSGEIYPVVVVEINRGSPADRAGLRVGDQIVSVDNQPIGSLAHLRHALARYPAGATVPVRVARDSQLAEVTITLSDDRAPRGGDELPAPDEVPAEPSPAGPPPLPGAFALGVIAADAANLPAEAPVQRGAVVQSLPEDSVAYAHGLRVGDVIVAWNGRVIASASDLTAAAANHPTGAPVELTYYRGQELQRAAIDPDAPPVDPELAPASAEVSEEAGGVGSLLGGLGRILGNEEAAQLGSPPVPPGSPNAPSGFETAELHARIDELEQQLEEVLQRLERLEQQSGSRDGF